MRRLLIIASIAFFSASIQAQQFGEWVMLVTSAGGGGSGDITNPSNYTNVCVSGCAFTDFSDAVDYVTTQVPAQDDRWVIDVSGNQFDEPGPIAVPDFTTIRGPTPTTETGSTRNPEIRHDGTMTSGSFLTLGSHSVLMNVYVSSALVTATSPRFNLVEMTANNGLIIGSVIFGPISDSSFPAATIYVSAGISSINESSIEAGPNLDGATSGIVVIDGSAELRLRDVRLETTGDAPCIYSGSALADVEDWGGVVMNNGFDLTAGGSYTIMAGASYDVPGEVLKTANTVTLCPSGCDYDTYTGAMAYVLGQVPSFGNDWYVYARGALTPRAFSIPDYTHIVGPHPVPAGSPSLTTPLASITDDGTVLSGTWITGGNQSSISNLYVVRNNRSITGDFTLLDVPAGTFTISKSYVNNKQRQQSTHSTTTIDFGGTNLKLDDSYIVTSPTGVVDSTKLHGVVMTAPSGFPVARIRNTRFTLAGGATEACLDLGIYGAAEILGSDFSCNVPIEADATSTKTVKFLGSNTLDNAMVLGGATLSAENAAKASSPGEVQVPDSCPAGETLAPGATNPWSLACTASGGGGVGNALDTEITFNNAGTLDGSVLTTDGTDVTLASGQLKVPNGTVAAPSYTFSGDPNTGFYSTGTDGQFSIANNGWLGFYGYDAGNGTAPYWGINSDGDTGDTANLNFFQAGVLQAFLKSYGSPTFELLQIAQSNRVILEISGKDSGSRTQPMVIWSNGVTAQATVNGLSTQADNAFEVRHDGTNTSFEVEASGRVTVTDLLAIDAIATAPATCSADPMEIYADTSGALCVCTSANVWTNTTGVGSCV